MRLFRVVLYCFLGITFTLASVAEEVKSSNSATLDKWSTHLRACLGKTFSVKGEFAQDVQCSSPAVESHFHGKFKVKRKGMYLWEYSIPQGRMMISDGISSFFYDKIEHRVIANHPIDALLAAITGMLTGETNDSFVVDSLVESAGSTEKLSVLKIVPKEPHRFIHSVLLTISENLPCVKRVIIVDNAGCIIRTTFQNTEINRGMREAGFRFRPPKNAVVIEP